MRGSRAVAALACGVAFVAIGGCFQAVEYGCDEDAQCRVGTAEGICASPGFCAYEDEACDSGRRFGPYAGAVANTCVDDGGTTSATSATSIGEVSSGSSGGASTSSDASGEISSSSDTGCASAPCGDLGRVLWSVADEDRGAGLLHGIDLWNGDLVVAGLLGADPAVEYVARYRAEDGTFIGGPRRGPVSGVAWDVVAISDDAVALVGERPGALVSYATLTAFDAGWTVPWAHTFESPGPDVLRAVVVSGTSVVSVGSFDGEGLVVVHDAADGSELDFRTSKPSEAAAAGFWSAAASTSGATLGGSFGGDEIAWVQRLLRGGALVTPPGVLPFERVLGVASLGASLDVVGGVGQGQGWVALVDTNGLVQADAALADGEVTAVAALADGGWIVVGTEHGDADRPWFSIYTPDFERVIEHVFEDGSGMRAEDVVVDGSVAYIAGGTAAPWLAAVVVGAD